MRSSRVQGLFTPTSFLSRNLTSNTASPTFSSLDSPDGHCGTPREHGEGLNFLGRKYQVAHIRSRRARGDTVWYLVHWEPTVLPDRFVREQTGRSFVLCDGAKCYVWARKPARGLPGHSEIIWCDTEHRAGDLPNAEAIITKYELGEQLPRQQVPAKPPETLKTSEVMRHFGVTPDVRLPDGLTSPPRANRNYGREIRSYLTAMYPPSSLCRKLLSRRIRRALKFRPQYFTSRISEKSFKLTNSRSSVAYAVYMTGHAQKRRCENCRENRRPFKYCVVEPGFARGACANCVFTGTQPRKCNYHEAGVNERWIAETNEDKDEVADVASLADQSAYPTPPSTTKQAREHSVFDNHSPTRTTIDRGQRRDSVISRHSHHKSDLGDRQYQVVGGSKNLQRGASTPATAPTLRPDGLGSAHERADDTEPEWNRACEGSEEHESARGIESKKDGSGTARNAEGRTPPTSSTTRASPQQTPPDNHFASKRHGKAKATLHFDHTHCRGPPYPCRNVNVSYGRLRSETPVRRGRVFQREEATDAEVRWLVSRMHCADADFLAGIWDQRVAENLCGKRPLDPRLTREAYFSRWLHSQLTKAAAEHGVDW